MPHAPVEPRSLWWDQRAMPAAPLEERTTADVVVVGAGIVGVTVAHDLALAGHDVVLLEAGEVASGATGHTSAKVSALQSPRYAKLAEWHGGAAAQAYARLSTDAVARVVADADRLATVALHRADALTWSAVPEHRPDYEAEAAAAQAAGLPVELVDHDDELPVAVGLRLRRQVRLDPVEHLRALLDEAVAAGLRVHESTAVTHVGLRGRRRQVRTSQGLVDAGHVVVATGLPVLDRGAWFARMAPHTSYVVVLRGGRVPRDMSLRTCGGTRSARAVETDDGPAVLVAGEDHEVGRGGDTRQRYEALAAWGAATFGATIEVARWSAQDWHPVDALPLAGPLVPGDERVLAAAGFAKWGLTSGTAAASALVRRVRGEPSTPEDRLLDPVRRQPPPALRELAATNLGVGWSMASGWLRALRPGVPTPAEGEGVVGMTTNGPVAAATVDGTTHRCRAVCPHLGGTVRWEPGDRTWACPLHGSRYDHDGRVLSGPTTRPLDPA